MFAWQRLATLGNAWLRLASVILVAGSVAAHGDEVLKWNETLLDAIRASS